MPGLSLINTISASLVHWNGLSGLSDLITVTFLKANCSKCCLSGGDWGRDTPTCWIMRWAVQICSIQVNQVLELHWVITAYSIQDLKEPLLM